MIVKTKLKTTAPVSNSSTEPQTYAEAVARELAAWGDSWQGKHDPLPTVCIEWKLSVIDLLRPVMLGAEWHRKILAAKVKSGAISDDQVERRATAGDTVRKTIMDWTGADWTRSLRRGHLAVLVSQRLLPAPTSNVVRQWLDGASATGPRRAPIDHDQRMRQAEGSFDTDVA